MQRDIAVDGSIKPALRTDIQALRGFAVLLVVLYHAGVPFDGYLGVDIFFVISGFLITSVIRKGLEGGTFTVAQFYIRRARRLLPAAYVVIAATVFAAPYFISDGEIHELRMQVVGAITFTANFVLWSQTDYFAGAADTKPLLHFWSLAIEEQYYFTMPLLLLLSPRRFWVPLIIAILIVSLAIAISIAGTEPSTAFYMPYTRIWELAIGSIGAFVPRTILGTRLLSAMRLPAMVAIILIPIYPTGFPHPSVDALLVCAATLLIILGHNRSKMESIPPLKALAKVGDFSYSLYLVHWPIIVFNNAAWVDGAPTYSIVVSVIIAILLSLLLYRFVELPFHKGLNIKPKKFIAGILTASMALLSVMAIRSSNASSVDFEHARRTNYGIGMSCAFSDRRPFNGEIPSACHTKEDARILIVGDSYAMAWASALIEPFSDYGLEQATMGACDPLKGMARFPKRYSNSYNQATAERCLRFQLDVLNYAKRSKSLELVVIAARFQTVLSSNNQMLVGNSEPFDVQEISASLVVQGIKGMVDDLRASGKKVVILAPPPANGSKIGDCIERQAKSQITFGAGPDCSLSVDSVDEFRKGVTEMLNSAREVANVEVVDMSDVFCDAKRCQVEIDGVPLYRDEGHLSVDGAKLIGSTSDLVNRILSGAR